MQVSRWGNSLAVRLPATVVDALGLREGDEIEVADRRRFRVARDARRDKALETQQAWLGFAERVPLASCLARCAACAERYSSTWCDAAPDYPDSARVRSPIASRRGYQLYDALILATAIEAGAKLYSDGRIVDRRLTIRNPFA
jgi:hypothetical protein